MIWVNFITTSLFSRALEWWLILGESSQNGQLFRLVNYYNLPRYEHSIHNFNIFIYLFIYHQWYTYSEVTKVQTGENISHIFLSGRRRAAGRFSLWVLFGLARANARVEKNRGCAWGRVESKGKRRSRDFGPQNSGDILISSDIPAWSQRISCCTKPTKKLGFVDRDVYPGVSSSTLW